MPRGVSRLNKWNVRFGSKAVIATPLFGQLIGCSGSATYRHSWQAQFRGFLEPGGKRSIRRMCSHLRNVRAKPITGMSATTTGMTKNAIRLSSEVSQKDV